LFFPFTTFFDHVHGYGLLIELAGLDGVRGALVTAQRKCILLRARHAVLFRHILRGVAHAYVGLRHAALERGIGRGLDAAHRNHAHALDTARDGDLDFTQSNARGGIVDRLQTGGAEAIDGRSRHRDGKSRAQYREARHIQPLFAFGHGAAQNDVFDLRGIETLRARNGFLHNQRGQLVRARVAQRTLEGFADRRSYR
jgi:hypothetical protein